MIPVIGLIWAARTNFKRSNHPDKYKDKETAAIKSHIESLQPDLKQKEIRDITKE